MLTIYETFHLVTSNDGIFMISTKKIDDPFVIVKNNTLGFFIIHAGHTNYNIREMVKNIDLLDLANIVTYYVERDNSSHWAVAIPYKGMEVQPNKLADFTSISVQKKFSAKDFPENFESYASLSIITGFPE
jgi:hypothetical protein